MLREPIHPGEFLADELQELGMSAAELVRILHVLANRISQIIAGKRTITADTALWLGLWDRTSDLLEFTASLRTGWSASTWMI